MNKKLLSVLGCSSSVAVTLLTSNSAAANTTSEYVFTAPEVNNEIADIPRSDQDYPFYDCGCNNYDPATVEKLDREGERSIQLYGCDCAGCRNLVRSLDKNPKS